MLVQRAIGTKNSVSCHAHVRELIVAVLALLSQHLSQHLSVCSSACSLRSADVRTAVCSISLLRERDLRRYCVMQRHAVSTAISHRSVACVSMSAWNHCSKYCYFRQEVSILDTCKCCCRQACHYTVKQVLLFQSNRSASIYGEYTCHTGSMLCAKAACDNLHTASVMLLDCVSFQPATSPQLRAACTRSTHCVGESTLGFCMMVYETIEDNEDSSNIQYIKLYNVGQKVVTRNCKGYLPSQVAFYLQNIHIGPRKIWLTRHAESVSQLIGEIGEDTGELTEAGRLYSMTLAKFIKLEQE
eukprot:1748-Heterococcus_DN1.PRE.5